MPEAETTETTENIENTENTEAESDSAEAATAGGHIDDAERAARQAALDQLMELMRPAVQADGGDLVVVDVDYDAGIVEVQLQGACGSCAISALTLQGGVERLLRQRLSWVTEVRGDVDESIDFLESSSLGRGGYVPRAE
ncbi:MAG TPA: NifU family protein [Acidimicrobiales bacterium]|nr:NifU family protein [Acidimicrobiales bacterium]